MGDLLGLVVFGLIAGYIVYKMGVKKGWWKKVDLKKLLP